jgi:hypothetical protein
LKISSGKNAEIKRPWKIFKSPMAFDSNSIIYSGTGQTSP